MQSKPISYQLIGYLHAMKAKGNNPRHIRQTIRKSGALVQGRDMRRLADVTAESVDAYFTGRRLGKGPSAPIPAPRPKVSPTGARYGAIGRHGVRW